jgi:hypothetical protein
MDDIIKTAIAKNILGCREELDADKCWVPAEYVLWGKLIASEGLGPRCHEHARLHVSDHLLRSRSDAAVIHIADLASDISQELVQTLVQPAGA